VSWAATCASAVSGCSPLGTFPTRRFTVSTTALW
jgi:hypothetical protein